jgi:hypothetical protein
MNQSPARRIDSRITGACRAPWPVHVHVVQEHQNITGDVESLIMARSSLDAGVQLTRTLIEVSQRLVEPHGCTLSRIKDALTSAARENYGGSDSCRYFRTVLGDHPSSLATARIGSSSTNTLFRGTHA